MKTALLFCVCFLQAAVLWAGPAEEKAARAAAIQKELATINAQLQANGGSFEAWAQALKPYREDLRFLGKAPARQGLAFQWTSARVIQCDDLDALPEGCRPFEAIVGLDRQLKARGIDLILAIIPSKLCVYPDYLTIPTNQPARAPADRQVAIALKRLHKKLLEADVEVIDLYTTFQKARTATGDNPLLVYAGDTHWNNAGCRVAAAAIAERLKRYQFIPAENPYTFTKSSRADRKKADPDLHVIHEKNGTLYRDRDDAPVLLTGDSYALYNYNMAAPAHFSAQIAHHIGRPLSLLAAEGLSFNMPLKLAENAHLLPSKRVIVWTFNDKMLPLAPGKSTWAKIQLPASTPNAPSTTLGTTSTAPAPRKVTATITEVSGPPPRNAPYPNYFLLAYSKDLDAVLHILALHQRKLLPAASLKPGDKIEVTLTPWKTVEKTHGRIQGGTLANVQRQISKPHYLAEITGAPQLTEADLQRAGEE